MDAANYTGYEEADANGPPAFAAWTELQSELGLVLVLVCVLVETGTSAGWTLVLVVELVLVLAFVVVPVVLIVVVSDITEELGAFCEPL